MTTRTAGAARRFDCDAGTIVGRCDGDLVRATGIRYARAARFGPPEPVPPAREPVPATAPSPACVQQEDPLAGVLRQQLTAGLPQDEHCQRLSITAPADAAPGGSLPVLVWLHGGAYVTGAGDASGYDPAALVREQRVVVVAVTYRLGALGYVGDGRRRPANLGLLDQLEALRWVGRNIAAFGGDPRCVTVFGESAGADAVAHLMICAGARGLFRRAILQSPPLGLARGRARMHRAMLEELAAVDAHSSLPEVLAAQSRADRIAQRFGLPGAMAFGPQYGHHPLPAEADRNRAWRSVAPEVDVLIGSNARELALYQDVLPILVRLARVPAVGPALREAAVRAATWAVFARPAAAFARRHRRGGGRAVRYRLVWGPEGNPLAAAHAAELPLVFGGRDGWRGSALVDGVPWPEFHERGRRIRHVWAQFARTGAVDGAPVRDLLRLR